MTCIVGIVHNDTVYIGGDSAGVDGWGSTSIRSDEKVFRNGEMIFGFTTSFSMGQALRYRLTIPHHHTDVDTMKYLVAEFIPAVQTCFESHKFLKTDSGRAEGGTFLLGYKGRLFIVESDFQVGENQAGYASVGSGYQHAVGALYASPGLKPKKRIRLALNAAQAHGAYVRGPFTIVRGA